MREIITTKTIRDLGLGYTRCLYCKNVDSWLMRAFERIKLRWRMYDPPPCFERINNILLERNFPQEEWQEEWPGGGVDRISELLIIFQSLACYDSKNFYLDDSFVVLVGCSCNEWMLEELESEISIKLKIKIDWESCSEDDVKDWTMKDFVQYVMGNGSGNGKGVGSR